MFASQIIIFDMAERHKEPLFSYHSMFFTLKTLENDYRLPIPECFISNFEVRKSKTNKQIKSKYKTKVLCSLFCENLSQLKTNKQAEFLLW